MLLRIEDIDPTRCKPDYTEAIFEDLAWLGLKYDSEVLHQSQRMDIYAPYIAELKASWPDLSLHLHPQASAGGLPWLRARWADLWGHVQGKDVRGEAAWRLDMERAVAEAGHWPP